MWALTDNQGTVRDLINSTGTILNHITYDSYGKTESESKGKLMFPISLSWTIGFGQSCYGGNKQNVKLDDVLKILKEITEKSGTANLALVNAPDVGHQSLQVQSENGYFVLTLGEHDDEDHIVRTYTNLSRDSQQAIVLGNVWDSMLICTESAIVIKIFKEFFETGDVSRDLLN